MGAEIEFLTHEKRPIDPAQVVLLYDTVPWGDGRDEPGILATLGTGPAVGVWDGDRLVGFTRALTDGRYRAYIEDVIIHPDYRGQQIGERMVAQLLEALADIEIVSLFCEPERVNFYSRNGFTKNDTQVMMHRRSQADVP